MCISSKNTLIKIRNKSTEKLSFAPWPVGFPSHSRMGNSTEWLAEELATVQKHFYDVDWGAR